MVRRLEGNLRKGDSLRPRSEVREEGGGTKWMYQEPLQGCLANVNVVENSSGPDQNKCESPFISRK